MRFLIYWLVLRGVLVCISVFPLIHILISCHSSIENIIPLKLLVLHLPVFLLHCLSQGCLRHSLCVISLFWVWLLLFKFNKIYTILKNSNHDISSLFKSNLRIRPNQGILHHRLLHLPLPIPISMARMLVGPSHLASDNCLAPITPKLSIPYFYKPNALLFIERGLSLTWCSDTWFMMKSLYDNN